MTSPLFCVLFLRQPARTYCLSLRNGEEKPRPFVYIIYLLHTLNIPYWSLLNKFFCPVIQANLVSLAFSPVYRPAISAKKCPPDGNNCVK